MRKILAVLALKSKTVNITALVAAIITICQQFGIELSTETVTAIFTLLAIVLRMITTQAIDEK
jgi:uncharacterized membrane protein